MIIPLFTIVNPLLTYRYPLVTTNIAMEKHHAMNGKIHYFYDHFPQLCSPIKSHNIPSFSYGFPWVQTTVNQPDHYIIGIP